MESTSAQSFYVRRRPWTPDRIARGALRHGPTAVADALAVTVVYLTAIGARIGELPFGPEDLRSLLLALGAGVLQAVMNVVFDVYWRDWTAAALEDVLAVAKASIAGTSALLLFNLVSETHYIPNGAILTGGGLVIVVQLAMRLRPRWRHILQAAAGRATTAQTAIVVCAGRVGQLLAQDLSDGSGGFRIACFVDDDPGKWGTYVRGKVVAGPVDDLPQLIAAYKPQTVIIAHPSPAGALVRRVLERCDGGAVRVRAVSGFTIRDGDTAPLRAIGVEELLEREPVELEASLARGYLAGRTVLVTGAAGSIGSEICRLIARLEPKRLVLLDTNESGLHDLVATLPNGTPTEMLLGDVRDQPWLDHVFAELRPEVIFHAAAYKHVPIIERTPLPGIATNVMGTANLLAAAAANGVGRFVFISTDKAVEPVSILGLTKRFGELMTIAYARALRVNYCVVRFGNVLGSAGSVVPIFTRQIDAGGPVTITDPDVTRYFMTIPEAAGLVLEAGAIADPGDLLVLDMGSPVSLVDLAQKMIRLRGLRTTDIPIVFTSLRRGEKLHERLFFPQERAAPTDHPRVLRVAAGVETPALASLRTVVEELRQRMTPRGVHSMVSLLRQVVAGGHHAAEKPWVSGELTAVEQQSTVEQSSTVFESATA